MVISRRGLAHVNASLQLLGICQWVAGARSAGDAGWCRGEGEGEGNGSQWDDITQSARVG